MTVRTVNVRLRSDVTDYVRGMRRAAQETRDFNNLANRARRPVKVTADTSNATTGVRTVSRELGRVHGRTARANVNVDTRGATRQVSNLTRLIFALGPATVPVAATMTAAFAGAAASVGALVAAGGTAMLAFGGVADAVKAMDDAETKAASNAEDAAERQVNAARSVEDAQRSLTRARQDAVRAAIDAAQRIADAARDVQDAEEAAAETARDGAQQVADAQRRLADVRRDGARVAEEAAERVQAAEENLARAHDEVRYAQESLTEARKDAARTLEDLSERSSDLVRDEERAQIALAKAQERLRLAEEAGWLSAQRLEELRLDVADAEDHLSDVRRDQTRTTEELTEAERKGVEGSSGVVSAKRALANAERGVADAANAVADAQRDAARIQRDTAREMKDAIRGVADAQRDAAQRNEDAAERVAEAQRGLARAEQEAARSRKDSARAVVDAQRNLKRASADASRSMAEQSTEAENLAEKLAALSPAAQDFAKFLFSLKPKLQELQATAAAGLFPGLEAGMREALAVFPDIERLVGNTASALGDLAERGGDALNDPFWRQYIRFIANDAGPTLMTFGRIVGNIAEGFAGMNMALDPLSDDFGDMLLRMSRKFSRWGRTLSSNEGFNDFVEYVREVSPQVGETLLSLASAVGAIVKAAAPIGPVVLEGIELLADTLATIANIPGVGTALVAAAAGIGAVSAAIRLFEVAAASRIVGFFQSSGRHADRSAGRLGGFARGLGGIGIGIGIALPLIEAFIDKAPDVDKMTTALETLARRGKVGASDLDALGVSFEQLEKDVLLLTRDKLHPDQVWSILTALGGHLPQFTVDVKEATARIKSVDLSLSEMVRAGNAELAAKAIKEMGLSAAEAAHLFPEYRAAMAQANLEAKKGKKDQQGLAGGLNEVNTSIEDLLGIAQSIPEAYSDFEESVDNLTDSLKKNSGAYDKNSNRIKLNRQSGRDLQDAVIDTVNDMVKLTKTLTDNKVSSEKATAAWNRNRDMLVGKLSKAFDISRGKAAKLLEKYGLLEDYADFKLLLSTPGAEGSIKNVKQLRDRIKEIKDKKVDIKVASYTSRAQRRKVYHQLGLSHDWMMRAQGGPVEGPGGPTEDRIPTLLSNGEFVVRTKMAKKHRPLIEAINNDQLPSDEVQHFARGGTVKKNLTARMKTRGTEGTIQNVAQLYKEQADRVMDMVDNILSSITTGVPGGSSRIVSYHGGRFTEAMANRIKWSETLADQVFNITQGGFRPRTSYSGGTHMGDAVDITQTSNKVVASMRRSGIAAWHRTPAQGPWGHHTHGVPLPIGNVRPSPSARAQAQAYMRGGDGLGGRDTGPKVGIPIGIGGASPKGSYQRYALSLFPRFGWSSAHFGALKELWNRESGWNPRAHNPSSGAHGIPQALPASKMRSAGRDYMTNGYTQIRWGENYIDDRYGNPSRALSFHNRHNWYDNGFGVLPPGPTMALNGTGRNEYIVNEAKLANAISTALRGTAGTAPFGIQVFIGDRELTDIVDVRISDSNRELKRRVLAGSGGGR